VVLEGLRDIHFLRHVSAILNAQDPGLPSLTIWEQEGRVVLLPRGGGDNWIWATCLAPLGLPEFHLIDREIPPATQHREAIVAAINRRPRCRAALTSKRSLENYLHPGALQEVFSVAVEVDDHNPVIEVLTERLLASWGDPRPWASLSVRSRRRWADRLKRSIQKRVVRQLTVERLNARDPSGEIAGWLRTIAATQEESV
jgi:hypothetical protein